MEPALELGLIKWEQVQIVFTYSSTTSVEHRPMPCQASKITGLNSN